MCVVDFHDYTTEVCVVFAPILAKDLTARRETGVTEKVTKDATLTDNQKKGQCHP